MSHVYVDTRRFVLDYSKTIRFSDLKKHHPLLPPDPHTQTRAPVYAYADVLHELYGLCISLRIYVAIHPAISLYLPIHRETCVHVPSLFYVGIRAGTEVRA